MKYTLAATAIILAMTAANAASPTAPTTSGPTLWQGDMFITPDPKSISACSSVGVNTGDFVQAIFAPKNLPGNSTSSDQFSMFFRRGTAAQIVPKLGTLSTSTAATFTIIDGAKTQTKNAPMDPFKISPSTITATTPSATISFPSVNFLTAGCNLTFQGTLSLRPGNWLPLVN